VKKTFPGKPYSVQLVTPSDVANPVYKMARTSRVDFCIVRAQIDLLKEVPEVWVLCQYAGVVARPASGQAVFQTQAARPGRVDTWAPQWQQIE
jgi:hypothetical protein